MWKIFLYSSERTNTSEKETNNTIAFLDVEISRDKNQFIISVYHKPISSGVFSHFDSFIPEGYKFNLVATLIFCCYSICCSMELFHIEIMQLKEIFEKNGDMTISFLTSVSEPF